MKHKDVIQKIMTIVFTMLLLAIVGIYNTEAYAEVTNNTAKPATEAAKPATDQTTAKPASEAAKPAADVASKPATDQTTAKPATDASKPAEVPTMEVELNKPQPITAMPMTGDAIAPANMDVSKGKTTSKDATARTATTAKKGTDPQLATPNLQPGAVINWAEKALLASFTYTYKNYTDQFRNLSKYYTPKGMKSFNAALAKSNNIQVITEKKMSVTAKTIGKGSMKEQGVLNNRYTWIVTIPLKVTYKSDANTITQDMNVDLIITRTTTDVRSSGIGISQIVASPAKGSDT